METTDEESSSTGHTETPADGRKVSPSVRFTLQTPGPWSASPLLTLDSGSDTVTDKQRFDTSHYLNR